MTRTTALVVTTIHRPSRAMQALAAGAVEQGWRFVVAADAKTPTDFALPGCEVIDVEAQAQRWRIGGGAPLNHYARKNVGYLEVIAGGAQVIVETDDDNTPSATFFLARQRRVRAKCVTNQGWVNIYRLFCDHLIWPRGLPLDRINAPFECNSTKDEIFCPVQQGLTDGDPDVDRNAR